MIRTASIRALAVLVLAAAPLAAQQADEARWRQRAQSVSITRDDWGIPHIRGRTDADAVFGMIYAQAEDDFKRVETNYLVALGRLAEAEGERAVFQDLRARMYANPDSLRARYAESPAWLRALMDAWADGLNFYLATHPEVTPRAIRRWEPWMALSFTEGSIGADIERISVAGLESFYGGRALAAAPHAALAEPSGSNGFAIAPRLTRNGHALLLINPHTSFFFRAEQQVTSDEGLNAYGAATWGQFFIYQGFNERAGWMHTTSGLDAVDEFLETVTERGGRRFYRYGTEERPLIVDTVAITYRTAGGMATRRFPVFRTHRGPVVREEGGRWVSVAMMHRPIQALSQSYLRTKARSFAEFRRVADEMRANSSNNTLFADAQGNIAYMHPHFIPRRDDRFDYTKPVDGSDPATDWKGLHALDEAPRLLNPRIGWIQNTNNWPYSAAGPESPRRDVFPRYMDTFGENARGIHALRVLSGKRGWTLDALRDAAYDPWLPAFEQLIPPLVQALEGAPAADRAKLAGPVALLRGWDRRWSASSAPTSLAVFWGEELAGLTAADARRAGVPLVDYMATRATPAQRLQALSAAVDRLERDFGSWRTPWGEINRFQRLTGDIVHPFSDAGASIPVPFTSGNWGSLASYGARRYPGTKRMYGTSGNSFVAVVEFGPRVRARAIMAGGQSGDPKSPHFSDQAERYAAGNLREVYFYPEQLRGNTERVYRPGERN
jgi:acyl-homoserine-lactone acylase